MKRTGNKIVMLLLAGCMLLATGCAGAQEETAQRADAQQKIQRRIAACVCRPLRAFQPAARGIAPPRDLIGRVRGDDCRDRHLVLRDRSRLIGADHTGTSESFHGVELANYRSPS